MAGHKIFFINGKKLCTKCRESKTESEFWVDKDLVSGRMSACIECKMQEQRKWQETRSHLLPCSVCGKQKTGKHVSYCKSCYNEYKREYYSRNREKEVARSIVWNKRNTERHKANVRKYHARHPLKAKQYKEANPDRIKANDARKCAKRRRAKISGLGVTGKDWIEIKQKFRQRCVYCSKKKTLTMDHEIPLVRGGIHEPQNIVPACKSCNSKKHALDPIQFAQRRGMLL